MPRTIRQIVKPQKGIVLVVALLILMVMTVIGTSMLSTATLEERMASNLQSQNAAFQAANSCFKNTINTPAGGADTSVTLTAAINTPNVVQNNACDDPVTGFDLYGGATGATAMYDTTSTFQPLGYEVGTFQGFGIPITVTSTRGTSGAGTTIQVLGGLILPI